MLGCADSQRSLQGFFQAADENAGHQNYDSIDIVAITTILVVALVGSLVVISLVR
jgi:hypothetical protein